jgi:hypothetical protein
VSLQLQRSQAERVRHISLVSCSSDSALDAASCMSSLFLFARSFPFGRFHPLEYVSRLSKAEVISGPQINIAIPATTRERKRSGHEPQPNQPKSLELGRVRSGKSVSVGDS